MVRSGIPQRMQSFATPAPISSILDSLGEPRLMWIETASAPRAIASSTVQTCTLSFGSGLSEVDPERWMMRPMSRPCFRWPRLTSPLWSTMAFAPPSLTSEMTFVMSSSPSICPIENPWSIGTMTDLPVFRFMIRSILISFPIIFTPSEFSMLRQRSCSCVRYRPLPGRTSPGACAGRRSGRWRSRPPLPPSPLLSAQGLCGHRSLNLRQRPPAPGTPGSPPGRTPGRRCTPS